MRKNRLGFTLIELLAVTLILGILTSIALPQYRRSVRRAEAMEALVNLRTLYDSAKRYRAANSQAPTKLQGLDISFFDASTDTESTFTIGKFDYTFSERNIKACHNGNGYYCLYFYYTYGSSNPPRKDVLICNATNEAHSWICENLGSRKIANGVWVIEG